MARKSFTGDRVLVEGLVVVSEMLNRAALTTSTPGQPTLALWVDA